MHWKINCEILNGIEQRSTNVNRAMNQMHGFTVNYSKFTLAIRENLFVFSWWSSDKTYKIGVESATSQATHQACASLRLLWMGCQSIAGLPPALSSTHPAVRESNLSCPRTQHNIPGQVSDPDQSSSSHEVIQSFIYFSLSRLFL